jgi:uncharacterized membrane protein (UPF0127 family)
MKFVTITNQSRADCPQLRVKYCASFWDNFKGLMFTPAIATDGGVLLVESFDGRSNTAIHMFFMRFDIAAIWINSNLEVVDCKLAKRWAPALVPQAPARYVLETHTNNLAFYQPGDKLLLSYD